MQVALPKPTARAVPAALVSKNALLKQGTRTSVLRFFRDSSGITSEHAPVPLKTDYPLPRLAVIRLSRLTLV